MSGRLIIMPEERAEKTAGPGELTAGHVREFAAEESTKAVRVIACQVAWTWEAVLLPPLKPWRFQLEVEVADVVTAPLPLEQVEMTKPRTVRPGVSQALIVLRFDTSALPFPLTGNMLEHVKRGRLTWLSTRMHGTEREGFVRWTSVHLPAKSTRHALQGEAFALSVTLDPAARRWAERLSR